jgi:hypothetical protein
MMKLPPVYLLLLHFPIKNRQGELVTTSVTNMDIHDISRSACTYGIKNYYVLTPLAEQHEIVGRILAHWSTDQSVSYHPDRAKALGLCKLVRDFDEVLQSIEKAEGALPEVVLTDASEQKDSIAYTEYLQELIQKEDKKTPILLVFGTGWGVHEDFYKNVHRVLKPVWGPDGASGYNHLSVRAAVAIILDRLFGQ